MNYKLDNMKIERLILLSTILFCSVLTTFGQKDYKPTASFTISGDVKSTVTIKVEDLKK